MTERKGARAVLFFIWVGRMERVTWMCASLCGSVDPVIAVFAKREVPRSERAYVHV